MIECHTFKTYLSLKGSMFLTYPLHYQISCLIQAFYGQLNSLMETTPSPTAIEKTGRAEAEIP